MPDEKKDDEAPDFRELERRGGNWEPPGQRGKELSDEHFTPQHSKGERRLNSPGLYDDDYAAMGRRPGERR